MLPTPLAFPVTTVPVTALPPGLPLRRPGDWLDEGVADAAGQVPVDVELGEGERAVSLQTDPRDVGCAEAMRLLHVYVEMVGRDGGAEERLPDVAAHLAVCGPCNEDFHGLLAAVRAAN